VPLLKESTDKNFQQSTKVDAINNREKKKKKTYIYIYMYVSIVSSKLSIPIK